MTAKPDMGMGTSILVIDQGTHSTRALLIAADGEVLGAAAVPVASSFPEAGRVEQSPPAIRQSALDAITGLVAGLTPARLQGIRSAALIVQRSSLLACRRDSLEPITPVISWQDTRNRAAIENLQAHHAAMKVLTGLRPNAHYGASKMRWLLDNDAAVQRAAAENNLLFAPLAAWLAAQLVGSNHCVVDPVIASRTLLMGLEDMDWHPQLLHWFGIDPAMLPAIKPSNHEFGMIMVGTRNIPLVLVGGDQSFIPFASGVPVDPDTAYVNVGTGAFVQMPKPPAGGDERLLYSPLVMTACDQVIVMEGTVNAAATALDWLWQQAGSSLSHAELAAAMDREKQPPVFINTLAGTGSPWWLAAQEPVFVGEGGLAARAVAVLESVVFALADNITCLQKANPRLGKLVIGGGLAQVDGFCRRLASLCGLPVLRPAMHEISALGAACYALQKARVEAGGDSFPVRQDAALAGRYQMHRQALCRLAGTAARA